MWIFTKHGFFSAVCARQGNGGHGQPVDPDRIMVRARLRSHLTAIKKRFPNLLGDCEIKEFPGADYAYRFFVPKSAWVQVIAGLAEEVDYDNFKSAVSGHQGQAGVAYENSLNEVWSAMSKLQQNEKAEEKVDEDSEVSENATRKSWKIHPMPAQRNRIEFHRTFNEGEFAKIKAGHIPQEMEDKWFVFFEDGWVYFHRSWTGYCIFQVKLKNAKTGCLVEEAWVNQDKSQYESSGDDEDSEMLTNVFHWSLEI